MKNITLTHIVFCFLFSIFFSPVKAASQQGVVKGRVTSEMKVTGDIEVTLTHIESNQTHTQFVTKNEPFKFNQLPLGQYKLYANEQNLSSGQQLFELTIGQTATINLVLAERIETITVTNQAKLLDISSPVSNFIINSQELKRIPVEQTLNSVALLAPGTVAGDKNFGKQFVASGTSVAENGFYFNGLNISNFRTGKGHSIIPFEFIDQIEVKSAGFGAEFGQATGGIVNAISKQGGNQTEFFASVYSLPQTLKAQESSSYRQDGSIFVDNRHREIDQLKLNLSASGAIVEDKLFYYLLFNPVKTIASIASGSSVAESNYWRYFYGSKFDWFISENHSLALTVFSDKIEADSSSYAFDTDTLTRAEKLGDVSSVGGGLNWILQYNNQLTDDLDLSVVAGFNERNRTSRSPFDSCPVVFDSRGADRIQLGCWLNFGPSEQWDERYVYNASLNYWLNEHNIKFGIQLDKQTTFDLTQYSGGTKFEYFHFQTGNQLTNGHIVNETQDVVRVQKYQTGGTFRNELLGAYLQDNWQINDNLHAVLGIRADKFTYNNAQGEKFLELGTHFSPSLGVAYSPDPEQQTKFYANIGRSYLPTYMSASLRLAGGFLFTTDFYPLQGINNDDTPIYDSGQSLGDTYVYADGSTADSRTLIDSNMDALHQDQLTLGYQYQMNKNWLLDLKIQYASLQKLVENVSITPAIEANGWAQPQSGSHVFILTNPGTDITTYYDSDGNGTVEKVYVKNSTLGLGKPERNYGSLSISAQRAWDENWMLNASYTWSHNYGNAEGTFKSDNGQNDPAMTTDWDYAYLMDGANGNLPNDRRHNIKLQAAKMLTEQIRLSVNYNGVSGRPINKFGLGYAPNPESYRGGSTWYVGNQLYPRGAVGTTDWQHNVDLALSYHTSINSIDFTIKLDVYNLLNHQTVLEIDERAEIGAAGNANSNYGLATRYQSPRYARLGIETYF